MKEMSRLKHAALSAVPKDDLRTSCQTIKPEQDYLDDIAILFGKLGDEGFYPALRGLMRKVTAFDDFLVIAYRPDAPPTAPYIAIEASNEPCGSFAGGLYKKSPFYRFTQRGGSGLRSLRELAPNNFYDSEFFREYMRPSRLLDEVGFVMQANAGLSLVVSLGRSRKLPEFSSKDLDLLEKFSPIVEGAVLRHNTLVKTESGGATDQGQVIPLGAYTEDVLTSREKEIVHYLVRGYSSKACANQLDISPATERVHRKNIYSKLGVHSQSELQAILLN